MKYYIIDTKEDGRLVLMNSLGIKIVSEYQLRILIENNEIIHSLSILELPNKKESLP